MPAGQKATGEQRGGDSKKRYGATHGSTHSRRLTGKKKNVHTRTRTDTPYTVTEAGTSVAHARTLRNARHAAWQHAAARHTDGQRLRVSRWVDGRCWRRRWRTTHDTAQRHGGHHAATRPTASRTTRWRGQRHASPASDTAKLLHQCHAAARSATGATTSEQRWRQQGRPRARRPPAALQRTAVQRRRQVRWWRRRRR